MAEKKTNTKKIGPEENKMSLNLRAPGPSKPQSGFLDMIKENYGTDLKGSVSPNGTTAGFNYNLGPTDIGASATVPFSTNVVQNPNEYIAAKRSEFVKGAPDLDAVRANLYARNIMGKNLNLDGTIDRNKNWNVSADYRPTKDTQIRARMDNRNNYNVALNQKINDQLALAAAYDKQRGPSAMLRYSDIKDDKTNRMNRLNAFLEARKNYGGLGVSYKF